MHKKCPPWKPGEDERFLKDSKIGPCVQVRPGGRESGWILLARIQKSLYPEGPRANRVGDGMMTGFNN